MPFLALVNGKKGVPAIATKDDEIVCHLCGQQMSLVEPKVRATHFRHPQSESSGGGSGGGDGSDCGGESPTHEKMKSIAADHLRTKLEKLGVLSDLHIDTKQVGDKTPDVLAELEPAQERFGEGIAIECQYRNKGKDYEETQSEYLDHGITTLWLEEDAFNLEKNTVSFSLGEWVHVWPNAVPEKGDWPGPSVFFWKRGGEEYLILTKGATDMSEDDYFRIDSRVPATFHLERWSRELDSLPPISEWGLRSTEAGYALSDLKQATQPRSILPVSRRQHWRHERVNERPTYLPQPHEPTPEVPLSFPAEWWRDDLREVHDHHHRLYRNRERVEAFQEVIPHLQKDLEHYYDYHRPRQEIGNIQEGIELLNPRDLRCPNPPVPIIREIVSNLEACGADSHEFVDLEGYYWRECRRCGLADVTLADLGQPVQTPNAEAAEGGGS